MGNKKIKAWRPYGLQIGESTDKLGFFGATPVVRPSAYTVTNITAARALNCNANNDLLTADTLGTLISDLINLGVLTGSVS